MNLKNILISAGLAMLSPIWLHATIEFIGVSTEKGETKIALVETSSGAAKWVKPGEQFGDYTLVNYNETEKSILLTKEDAELRLKLKEAKVIAVAREEATTESPASVTNPSEYIIKAGDTGARIAKNTGITLADLRSLNPDVNWSKLYVGQKIRIK